MWILRRVKVAKRKVSTRPRSTHYHQYREEARAHIVSRLEYFNLFYKLPYNRVAIRNQKRCWGSCSAKRNLNFSYKLLFLPPCLCDYIIVHELCHLRELNHSARFWAVVEERLPDYQQRAAHMRHFERTQGTSIKALQHWQQSHEPDRCAFCIFDKIAHHSTISRNTEISTVKTCNSDI